MTAKEANQAAYKFNTSETNSEYYKVQVRIKEAASKGEYEVYWSNLLRADVEKILKSEGYNIRRVEDRDADYHQISWK